MNGDQPPGTGSLPLSLEMRVDEACDRFEKAWKDGQGPRIEEYLAAVPEPDRVPLFRELLALEIELRCNAGETPTREEYRQRFPEFIGPTGPAEAPPAARHDPRARPRICEDRQPGIQFLAGCGALRSCISGLGRSRNELPLLPDRSGRLR
jgi:hypothetical protein